MTYHAELTSKDVSRTEKNPNGSLMMIASSYFSFATSYLRNELEKGFEGRDQSNFHSMWLKLPQDSIYRIFLIQCKKILPRGLLNRLVSWGAFLSNTEACSLTLQIR